MKEKISYLYRQDPYKKKRSRKYKKRKLDQFLKKFDSNNSDSESSDDEFDEDCDYDEDVSHKDNKIYFKCNITGETVEKLIKKIDLLNDKFDKLKKHKMIKNAEPNPIYLHITSYGGSLLATFRAIDAIKRSKIPIYTVIDGYAASGATLMS